MGTTFVTTHRESATRPGFWISDSLLELWLRLLALHLPEPTDQGDFQSTRDIRDRWLLASRGYFTGCVPHGLEEACATASGTHVVRLAITSLVAALERSEAPLDADTLNLLGIENGEFTTGIERGPLRDVAQAFVDLLDGRITSTAASNRVVP